MSGSTGTHFAEELMTDPPAKLTPRGLVMLTEIWVAAGRPAKPKPKGDDDGTLEVEFADIADLKSHHGTDAKRRSAARVRVHLTAGGYLHITEWQSFEDAANDRPATIYKLGLSVRAFAMRGPAASWVSERIPT